MMTQSVMTQAANLFGSAAGSVTTKGKQTGTGFDILMNNNMKSVQNNPGNMDVGAVKKSSMQKTEKADLVSDSNQSATDQTEATQSKTRVVSGDKTDRNDGTKATETNETGQAKDVQESETDPAVPDEKLVAQIEALLSNVQQTILNALNLSPEEFEQLLTDQGMSISDLLQPENLQQFILASQGTTDITAVLTDEKLAATMKDLMQTVNELVQEANLELTPEEMKAILSKAEELKQMPKEETLPVADTNLEKEIAENKVTNQPEAVNSGKSEAGGNKTADNNQVTSKAGSELTVKTDSSSESSNAFLSDKGQDDRSDLKTEDPFQLFVDNLVKSSNETQVEFSGNMVQVTQIREIANQIIDRIKVSVTPDTSTMELQLNPENLGKVNLTVQSKNGVMTAQFVVQNEISKEAIESQLATLKETLNSQGIKVEAIEVTVSSNAFEQNSTDNGSNDAEGQKSNSGNKITMEEAINMTEQAPDEGTATELSDILGSTVDYTA